MPHPEFPLASDLIYFNYAAVAPWPERTRKAVVGFAEENAHFGAAHYPNWMRKEIELREQFRDLLNAPSAGDIALVKNTSEALSFVAFGLGWQDGDNIVTSNEEFPSNRLPWEALANRGVELRQADLYSAATPEDALFALVDRHTRLITISSIQFATGLRLDVERIGEYCKARDILFCVDAIQSLGAVRFDVQACQADFVMADGHKWLLGPEGLGVFYSTPEARDRLTLKQYGWHMMKDTHNYENKPWEIHPTARRFECGSPNMLGIHALSASLSLLLETGMATVEAQLFERIDRLRERIEGHPDLEWLSPTPSPLKSGIAVFRHKNIPNAQLHAYLMQQKVICALRGAGIRFSPHFYNDLDQIDHAIKIIDGYSS